MTRQVAKQSASGTPTRSTVPAPRVAAKATGAERANEAHRSASLGRWAPGQVITAVGAQRYWLYQPPALQAGEFLPLIVMLHGCQQDAQGFAASTRMNRLAARERCCVLYPEQSRRANPQGCWNWFASRSGRAVAEVASILKAIDQVLQHHRIDPQRVAVAGLSAGASMAALLATRHPERFRALVMHSGVPPGMAHSSLTALAAMRGHGTAAPQQASTAWPPLLVIHGRLDTVVAARNGLMAAQSWATAAGAGAPATREMQRGQRHAVTLTDFKRKGRIVARLADVSRLGHAWSGGAAKQPFSDAQGPDASRMVWAFAAQQFRQQAWAPAGAPAGAPDGAAMVAR